MDVMVVEPTSPDVIAYISPDHINMLPVSPLPSLPSPSLDCHSLSITDYHVVIKGKVSDYIEPLGTFSGYNPSFDPYRLYLETIPLKIMFTTAFNFFADFSKAF